MALRRAVWGAVRGGLGVPVRRGACADAAAAKTGSAAEEGGGGKKGVVLCVNESSDGSFELSDAAREFDQTTGGAVTRSLTEWGARLRTGSALLMCADGEEAVAVASVGARDRGYCKNEELDETRENIRLGVGAGVRLLAARGCGQVRVDPCSAPDAAAEAAKLAAWRFQEFKSCSERVPETRVSLLKTESCDDNSAVKAKWAAGATRGRAQNWARWLSDMPANRMTPTDFAQEALNVLCALGVSVDAWERSWLQSQGMRAMLTVAQGSCEPPVLLEARYDGAGGDGCSVLLVAKGITFDSGGLCLKRPKDMMENRGSMAGAAVAVAALRSLAEMKVPLNVRCVIPLCENMISGQCMKVGDVVPALNGLNIKIEDTDMEGRLVLADALVYGQARYKPALVVDVATLTHGILVATDGGAFGCFSNNEAAWAAMRAAGAISGDRPWRFPLWAYYNRQLTDDKSVDLRNSGSGHATPCLGAAFLKNFVCCDWLHLDITGVGKLGHDAAPPYLDARRMTGRPARTLATFLENLAATACKGASDKCQAN